MEGSRGSQEERKWLMEGIMERELERIAGIKGVEERGSRVMGFNSRDGGEEG